MKPEFIAVFALFLTEALKCLGNRQIFEQIAGLTISIFNTAASEAPTLQGAEGHFPSLSPFLGAGDAPLLLSLNKTSFKCQDGVSNAQRTRGLLIICFKPQLCFKANC